MRLLSLHGSPILFLLHRLLSLGCSLGVAMEEVDLSSQHVGEACSAFVDVVVAAGAAEQFGPRCLAGDFERGRDGSDTVCLGNDEQEGNTHDSPSTDYPSRANAVATWEVLARLDGF